MINLVLFLLTQPGADCDYMFSAKAFAADTFVCRPKWFITYTALTPDPWDKTSMRLLELADSIYFSSCDSSLRTECQRETRKTAYAVYEAVTKIYPYSSAEPYVRTTLAWRMLEQARFEEAVEEFKDLFDHSEDKDIRVIAAYGKGLCHFYLGEYEEAFGWLLDEEGYLKNLKIASNKEDEDTFIGIAYNETADSLVDKALLMKALAAERLRWWGDALAIYRQLTDEYSERASAGKAWFKIVDFYLQAREVEKAEAATYDLVNPRIPVRYMEWFKHALALMYDYMLNVAFDTAKAEGYKKQLMELDGSDELSKKLFLEGFIEKYYQDVAMGLTDPSETNDLREVIDHLHRFNPQSNYLPRPLTLLGLLLTEAKRYDEADSVFNTVKNWPDNLATLDLLPAVEFHLARIQYWQARYIEATTTLETWLKDHEDNREVDPNLKAAVYWYLGLACMQNGEREKDPRIRVRLYKRTDEAALKLKQEYSETAFYECLVRENGEDFYAPTNEVYPR
ncbi:tetratricopeptide repeat protein [candidate division WOR-3 bacterium]|nr:tetratricopeptide repeat protein [candidate division WOR-3 bacterium]